MTFNVPNISSEINMTMIDNEDHVLATLTPGFSVRQSTIPNTGLGVFAETTISSGTRLGPNDGTLSKQFHGDDWTYIFLVAYKDGKTKHYIDGKNKETSSWLRYTNCACTIDEENLDVFQYNYEIYYVTNQCIKPGTELLIWYGDSYGKSLGVQRTLDDDDYAELSGRNVIVEIMNTIKGYCFHFGRYIKKKQEFVHTDNVNKCECHMTGRWNCSDAHASLETICSY